MRVKESYQLAVGATAGVPLDIALGHYDFLSGPKPNITMPVFEDTMAGALCSAYDL